MTRSQIQAGRQKFLAFQAEQFETARLLREQANDKREVERPEALVIRPLVVAIDPETGERHVRSELRREYYPGTSPEFVAADKARRMGDQSIAAAVRTVGVIGAIKGRLGRLFR